MESLKKQIDQLIELHKEGYTKYTLLCSVSDFKQLQRLMNTEYHIKDYPGNNSMWVHNGTRSEPTRIGTVRFNNFELNVTCPSKYVGEIVIEKVDVVDDKFKNSRKL
jgi:hypothetical protein